MGIAVAFFVGLTVGCVVAVLVLCLLIGGNER